MRSGCVIASLTGSPPAPEAAARYFAASRRSPPHATQYPAPVTCGYGGLIRDKRRSRTLVDVVDVVRSRQSD